MSKELIERLRYGRDDGARDEAADLIEAQQKRISELEMNLDACASECLGARKMATDYAEREKNLMAGIMESTRLSDDLFSKGYRLAFVLEAILLATDSDMAAISKYWDEAHQALEEWRK